jgi:hypothetical protein
LSISSLPDTQSTAQITTRSRRIGSSPRSPATDRNARAGLDHVPPPGHEGIEAVVGLLTDEFMRRGHE